MSSSHHPAATSKQKSNTRSAPPAKQLEVTTSAEERKGKKKGKTKKKKPKKSKDSSETTPNASFSAPPGEILSSPASDGTEHLNSSHGNSNANANANANSDANVNAYPKPSIDANSRAIDPVEAYSAHQASFASAATNSPSKSSQNQDSTADVVVELPKITERRTRTRPNMAVGSSSSLSSSGGTLGFSEPQQVSDGSVWGPSTMDSRRSLGVAETGQNESVTTRNTQRTGTSSEGASVWTANEFPINDGSVWGPSPTGSRYSLTSTTTGAMINPNRSDSGSSSDQWPANELPINDGSVWGTSPAGSRFSVATGAFSLMMDDKNHSSAFDSRNLFESLENPGKIPRSSSLPPVVGRRLSRRTLGTVPIGRKRNQSARNPKSRTELDRNNIASDQDQPTIGFPSFGTFDLNQRQDDAFPPQSLPFDQAPPSAGAMLVEYLVSQGTPPEIAASMAAEFLRQSGNSTPSGGITEQEEEPLVVSERSDGSRNSKKSASTVRKYPWHTENSRGNGGGGEQKEDPLVVSGRSDGSKKSKRSASTATEFSGQSVNAAPSGGNNEQLQDSLVASGRSDASKKSKKSALSHNEGDLEKATPPVTFSGIYGRSSGIETAETNPSSWASTEIGTSISRLSAKDHDFDIESTIRSRRSLEDPRRQSRPLILLLFVLILAIMISLAFFAGRKEESPVAAASALPTGPPSLSPAPSSPG